MKEQAVLFGGKTALVGVISDPPPAAKQDSPAVIFLNAGGLHRVGPSRLYVRMARNLADLGFVCLRFDFAGFGDSEMRQDQVPFAKSAVGEVQRAMDFLTVTRNVDKFILIGICSGAEASFDVASCDSRVTGAVLINGRGYDIAEALDFDAHSVAFFRRALGYLARAWPRVAIRKTSGVASHGRYTAELSLYQLSRMFGHRRRPAGPSPVTLRTLIERGVELLMVYDERDPIVEYLGATLGSGNTQDYCHAGLEIEIMRDADHTFNSIAQQQHLMETICNWALRWCQISLVQPSPRSVAV